MTLGAKEYKYQNKEDGFIFTAKDGSAEHRILRNHPDYDLIALEAVDEPVDLNDYTVDQLIEVAKEMGITGYSSMKKKELIKAISEDE